MLKSTMILAGFASLLAIAPAMADGSMETRASNAPPKSQLFYCVKNSESGACEECASKGDPAHKSSTCSELKNATNNPMVRSGHCSDAANVSFCKKP